MLYYIYKICCDEFPDYVYVGSTQAFRQRKNQHKSLCNNENCKQYNFKLYQTIREYGGWDNWRMICIDEINVENKRQAEMKEEEWRMKLQANLNMIKPYITEEQKKERDRKNASKYFENNKDECLKKKIEWYEKNKEEINNTRRSLYETNKEQILEQNKKYREKIRDKLTEKITCECGSIVSRQQMRKHVKTKKHEAWEWRQNVEL